SQPETETAQVPARAVSSQEGACANQSSVGPTAAAVWTPLDTSVLSPCCLGACTSRRRQGARGRSIMRIGDTHYQDRVVRIAELVGDRMPPVIEGFTFDGCHIMGPAVVGLEASAPGAAGISNSNFDGDPDALFL